MTTVNQKDWKPTRKVFAGMIAAGLTAVAQVYLTWQFPDEDFSELLAELGPIITAVAGGFASYMVKERA